MRLTNDMALPQPLEKVAVKRFWSHVRVGQTEECWPWQLSLSSDGYGTFWFRGRSWLAHRLAYFFVHGSIPDCHVQTAHGTVIRHSCDNCGCCNPSHLIAGTQLDNIRDRGARGRHAGMRGTKHPGCRLTENNVRYIRQASLSPPELAQKFQCTRENIYRIQKGVSWRHLL